jgi:hypothetical protein
VPWFELDASSVSKLPDESRSDTQLVRARVSWNGPVRTENGFMCCFLRHTGLMIANIRFAFNDAEQIPSDCALSDLDCRYQDIWDRTWFSCQS